MFRAAMCPLSGELLYHCDTWFMSLCVDDRLACRSMLISILYMFRAAMCPLSGELLYHCDTWFMSLCVYDRLACRSMFISILYMFRSAMYPSSGELLYQCCTWFMSLCVDDRLACNSICSCIPDGHLHRVTYARCRIDTIILLMMDTWLPETCRE